MRVTPTDTVMRLVEQLRVQAERGREREREQESAAAAVQQALTRQLADASSRHKEALQLWALKERECHEHEWVIEGLQEKVEASSAALAAAEKEKVEAQERASALHEVAQRKGEEARRWQDAHNVVQAKLVEAQQSVTDKDERIVALERKLAAIAASHKQQASQLELQTEQVALASILFTPVLLYWLLGLCRLAV